MYNGDDVREAREAEHGYQESTARELRLRDWWSMRDARGKDREFAALENRLRVLKWQREVRAERGDRYRRLALRQRVWLASVTPEKREARRVAAQESAEVITCSCGAKFCNLPLAVGRPRRWCSLECQKRGTHREKRKGIAVTCVCGASWCATPWATGMPRRYCSLACRNEAKRRRAQESNP